MRKLSWSLYFILLGILSIISQSALLREITTSFYGNEVFYGLSLGVWFFFTGVGSLIAMRAKSFMSEKSLPWFLLVVLTGIFPIMVFLTRYLRSVFSPLGEAPDLGTSILMMCLVLGGYCLLLGVLFTLGVLVWDKRDTNKAYFWETVGFGIGGLLFAFILASTNFPFNEKLNELSYKNQHKNIVYNKNSKHNHILITELSGVRNYFLGGRLAFTDEEKYQSEKLLATLTPYANKTHNVLVLGNPNLAKELTVSKNVENVGFLEIDKELYELEKEITGEQVDVFLGDPRKSLSRMKNNWDMVIFDLGNPETLSANRYFTVESFRLVYKSLKQDGVFNLILYLPSSYQSQEALHFVSSIYLALEEVFPHGKFLMLEDQVVFIAAKKPVKVNPELIDKQWEDHFNYVNNDFKHKAVFEKITAIDAKTNKDLEPTAFYHQQLFWQTIFSFKLPRVIFKYSIFVPLILLSTYVAYYLAAKEKRRTGLLMSAASFLLITIEVIIILFFQVKIGFLYNQLSLIFAAALLGMALGVRIGERSEATLKNVGAMFFAFLLFLFTFYLGSNTPVAGLSLYWLSAMFVVGIIGGAVFAILNNIYLENEENPGYIYAFDLLGGSLGALLASTLLLPVFGVPKVLLGLAVLVIVNLIFIARHR